MNESNVLAEVNNENQTLVAVVQQDSRAAYFISTQRKSTVNVFRCVPVGCATWLRLRSRKIAPLWKPVFPNVGGRVLP